MSHGRERKEKDCLNCGTIVQGRYCQTCGQENIEPKESFWQLVAHFFYDITHFDGKFFHSLKYLVARPGFLPKEYMAGRRASYLHPVRMYIFTSAFFFLLFFSFSTPDDIAVSTNTTINGKSFLAIDEMDSASFSEFTKAINKNDHKAAIPMTRQEFARYADTMMGSGIHFTNSRYKSRAEYDSVLKAGIKKHNWIERQLIYKEIRMNDRYHNNTKEILAMFRNKLLHSIPQMLFVSLPLLALLLKLIYIRRRKQFFYMSHAMLSIYLYIFIFIAFFALFGVSKLNGWLHWGFLRYLFTAIVLSIFYYEYRALKNFYGQGWFKTLVKFFLVNILFFVIVAIVFVLFVITSLIEL